ncbi:MAG: peptide-methionine (S)-S-oxide reductase MsrA [Gemmatimonadetes bacterium]|nr:peptide-methionine (S)-S-oxide reductase MsrA [Gemmatimonadota bacterium]
MHGEEWQMALATLGGGCFWCLEAVFERVAGVTAVVSGYAGGHVPSPSYEAVCAGITGHAEVVQLDFDPAVVGYRDLLEIFFTIHDPTTLNRQGPDSGTQYRSAIYTHDAEQQAVAAALMAELEADAVFPRPIVTEVTPLDTFWPAEAHHQQYFRRHPAQPYCAAVIAPKVAKLRAKWASRLRNASGEMTSAP